MKNVIVTGANGFVGSSLIEKLIEKQVNIIAIDISFANSKMPKNKFVTEVEVNLDDIDLLLKELPNDEYDAFYHLAWTGVNGVTKSDPIIQLKNIEMAINCATIAKEINVKKFLCSGTIAERSVESLPNLEKVSGGMMYGVAKYCTHLMLETYCKSIGLNLVWMQFSNIYGPTNKTGNLVSYTLGELTRGNEAKFGPALQIYDFIHVDDLLEAIIRLGESNTTCNSYFIGSGKAQILKDYLIEIGRICGKEKLIRMGIRPDDGIKYTLDMFDTSNLEKDIGQYVSWNFTDGIKNIIDKY